MVVVWRGSFPGVRAREVPTPRPRPDSSGCSCFPLKGAMYAVNLQAPSWRQTRPQGEQGRAPKAWLNPGWDGVASGEESCLLKGRVSRG